MLAGAHITAADSSVPTQQAYKLMNDLTTFFCDRLFGGGQNVVAGLPWRVDEGRRVCIFCDGTRVLISVPFHGFHADVSLFVLAQEQEAVARGVDLAALTVEHGVTITTTTDHLHGDEFDIVLRRRLHSRALSEERLEYVFNDMLRCCKQLESALHGEKCWAVVNTA